MAHMQKAQGPASDNDSVDLLLMCTDIPLHHWLLTNNGFKVALNVNQLRSTPSVSIRGNRMFLGAEQGIFSLDMDTGKIINEITDVSNVQWIDETQDCVLFAAEDEVIALDGIGDLLWRTNLPDVIEMTRIINNYVVITDMSGEEYRIDLRNGTSI